MANVKSRIADDEINMVNSNTLKMTIEEMLHIKNLNTREQQDQTVVSLEVPLTVVSQEKNS